MKKIITFLIFSIVLANASAQMSKNVKDHALVLWAKTPVNFLPLKYTVNHFKLLGKVKSLTETSEDGSSTYYEFSKDGFLQNTFADYLTPEKKIYTYDFSAGIISVEESNGSGGKAVLIKYYLNKKNQLIKTVFQKETGKNELLYTYDKSGFLLEENGTLQNGSVPGKRVFEYNAGGQVIKDQYSTAGKISFTNSYIYANEGKNLVITSKSVYANTAGEFKSVYTYNSAGFDLAFVNKDDESKYTYTLDKEGNWIKQVTEFLDYKTKRKTTQDIIEREIIYY